MVQTWTYTINSFGIWCRRTARWFGATPKSFYGRLYSTPEAGIRVFLKLCETVPGIALIEITPNGTERTIADSIWQ